MLIQTKLHPPIVNENLVERPLLMQKLNHNRKRPLTLITAPAGYGKSTLLSSWLKTMAPQPTAWLSLDTYDDNLTTYLTYFIAAIQTMFPNTGQEAMALSSKAETVPQRVLLSTLINDLNTVQERFVLILDDYHLIENKKIHDFMSEFLSHAPSTTHLVLASRTDPRLPIVEYRSKNKVIEIRAQDLRFTLSETNGFLQQNLGRTIDDTITKEIHQRSEGWVTGLNLVVLSMRRSSQAEPSFDMLNTNNQFVTDYLMAETLSNQDEIFQEWLLKTAVLDRFCPALCDALCSSLENSQLHSFNGQIFKEYLTNNHLFIIALDNEQTWYRYHHLFGQFLRQVAKQRYTEAELALLHSKAAQWLAKNQLLEESLHHALIAKDFDTAAQVVEDHARTLLDEDKWHILEVWLAQLPNDQIQQRPILLLAKAWIAFHQFALRTIPPILERIEEILTDDAEKRPLWGEVDFFWGHHWYWHGQQEKSLNRLSQALERIPKTHHLARGETELFWGLAMQMAGKKNDGIQKINQWLYYEHKLHPGRQTKLVGAFIFIHLLTNELTEASLSTQQLYDIAIKKNIAYIKAWSAYLLGQIYFCQHDLENAINHFQEAIQSRYVLHKAAAIDTLAGLAFCYQSSNQSKKAESTMSDLQTFAWETNNPAYITIARSAQTRLALSQGDAELANRLLQSADLTTDAGILFYWLETPRLTECRVLVAQGTDISLAEAQKKLTTLHHMARTNHNTLKMVEILLLQTMASQKQNHLDDALQTLQNAAKLASIGNYLRPFIEAGPELIKLIPQLPPTETDSFFIQNIQKSIVKQYPTTAPSESLEEILTYREKELLTLLAQKLSNQEIATELTISLHTVKRHASSVYQKLNVKNRRQAVIIAQKAGLLSAKESKIGNHAQASLKK